MAEEHRSTDQLEVSASNCCLTQEVATAATGTSESNAVKDGKQTIPNTPSGSANDDAGCSAFPVVDSESAESDADEPEAGKYTAEMTDEQMNDVLLEIGWIPHGRLPSKSPLQTHK